VLFSIKSIARNPRQSLILDIHFIVVNPESFLCQLISWDEAYRLAKSLAREIKSSGYRPDLVIAIGRGGYIPARIVCDFMLHSLLTSIKIEHWGIAAQKQKEAVIRFPLAIGIHDQRILIIDDVTDTGDTLRTAVDYVQDLKAREIKTGVLQHKTTSSFVPDFYADIIKDWRWIIYPWAAYEDLLGFVEKVLSVEFNSIENIHNKLEERYSLKVDDDRLEELLEDLISNRKVERKRDSYRKTFSA
jgi:uncharacterized protein